MYEPELMCGPALTFLVPRCAEFWGAPRFVAVRGWEGWPGWSGGSTPLPIGTTEAAGSGGQFSSYGNMRATPGPACLVIPVFVYFCFGNKLQT